MTLDEYKQMREILQPEREKLDKAYRDAYPHGESFEYTCIHLRCVIYGLDEIITKMEEENHGK